MRVALFLSRFLCGVALFSLTAGVTTAQWWTVIFQTGGRGTNLRAVSAAWFHDARDVQTAAVWASGSDGVILRSTDEGKSWHLLHVPDGDTLDFRGIAALNDKVAYVMSIGNGDKSRIYKTIDGGQTWKLQFTGPRKETFLDAISCDSAKTCVVLGDPIDDKFLLMTTEDGEHWKELLREKMPTALPGEGAFAASNSSLCVDDQNIYFGTGGAAKARVFHSVDSGKTWTVEDTPIASGNASSGIFSLDCKGGRVLYAVGGDYKDSSRSFHSGARLQDPSYIPGQPGGWQLSKQQPGGFRSGVAQVDGAAAVAVGPTGEDITQDFGVTWEHTDSLDLNAVKLLGSEYGWAVGPKGTIARFQNRRQYLIRNDDRTSPRDARANDCCLPRLGWVSTLARSLQLDFLSSPPERRASPSPMGIGGSKAGRQDVIHLH